MTPDTLAVLRAVTNDAYPPTNPAVLLAAARDMYLSHGPHAGIVAILAWTLHVMSENSPSAFTDEERQAVSHLYLSRSLAASEAS